MQPDTKPALQWGKAEFITSYGVTSELPLPEAFEVVLAGRSNVGKSSLINKLANRKNLARTSATPGKTATVNLYRFGGVPFLDLPGYGYAKVSRLRKEEWNALLERFFTQRQHSFLLLLLDSRHAPSEEDMTMLAFLHHHRIPFFAVLTKGDKLKKSEKEEQQQAFAALLAPYAPAGIYLVSAETGEGIEALQEAVQARAEAER